MKIYKLGVFGSGESTDLDLMAKAYQVGKTLAAHKQVVVTGCCYGLPGAAVDGARNCNGKTLSFSPARNLKEHVEKYHLPPQNNEDVIYTGSDFVQRDVINVKACDGCIVIGGMTGTNHELALSLELDLVIGILEGSGGICDLAWSIAEKIRKPYSKFVMIQESDPTLLVQQVIQVLDTREQK